MRDEENRITPFATLSKTPLLVIGLDSFCSCRIVNMFSNTSSCL